MQIAVSFQIFSAIGSSQTMLEKGFLQKVASKAAIITIFPILASFQLYQATSGKNWPQSMAMTSQSQTNYIISDILLAFLVLCICLCLNSFTYHELQYINPSSGGYVFGSLQSNIFYWHVRISQLFLIIKRTCLKTWVQIWLISFLNCVGNSQIIICKFLTNYKNHNQSLYYVLLVFIRRNMSKLTVKLMKIDILMLILLKYKLTICFLDMNTELIQYPTQPNIIRQSYHLLFFQLKIQTYRTIVIIIKIRKMSNLHLTQNHYESNPEQHSPNHRPRKHKKEYSQNLTDSHSTFHSSFLELLHEKTVDEKISSFKKIKQIQIKQKNSDIKIIKKMVVNSRNRSNSKHICMKLDDARSIVSHSSDHSQRKSRCLIDESIILLKGRDFSKNFITENQLNEPQTPFWKCKSFKTIPSQKQRQKIKILPYKFPLLIFQQIGFICHFQLLRISPLAADQIKKYKNNSILSLYGVQMIEKGDNLVSTYVILYEPFTDTLEEAIQKHKIRSYKQFLSLLVELVKILSHLADQWIFPVISADTILLSGDVLKIKIRPNEGENFDLNDKDMAKQCGYFFTRLMSKFSFDHDTPRSKSVLGLEMGQVLEFGTLMSEVISDEIGLEELYLKLQALPI